MRVHPKAGMAAVLILGVVTLSQCGGESAKMVDALPPGVDLASAKAVEIRDGAGQVVLAGTFADHKASLKSADPNSKAEGSAELEIEKDGKQEIEASVEDLPASSSFKLVVDGQEVGTFTTTDKGKQALKYARKGQ